MIDVRARAGIAYVPQGREIFPHLTVLENLQVGLLANRARPRSVPGQVFDYFPMLRTLLDRKGGLLSGGQQTALFRFLLRFQTLREAPRGRQIPTHPFRQAVKGQRVIGRYSHPLAPRNLLQDSLQLLFQPDSGIELRGKGLRHPE